ncbi:MAG: hypothetical protein K6C40_14045 [Thermoguttaceae bacterium]|nr:hypothetical protein [Thermoguttaceae bacterium]
MKVLDTKLFSELQEAIQEKVNERLSIMLAELQDGFQISLDQIVKEEMRKFWKESKTVTNNEE